ncbi:MAG: NADH-quinone oxidoreductase subunit J [Nostocoides sp.]
MSQLSAYDVVLVFFGVLAVGAGVLAVSARHLIHAGLWLVVSLGAVAGIYLVLGAEFVALVQVLVYVGAIVVLVLFALMVTRNPVEDGQLSTSVGHRVLAGIVGAGVAALLLSVLLPLSGTEPVTRLVPSTPVIGADIFGTWVWPFELLSLLLLAALVAGLAVAAIGRAAPSEHASGPAGNRDQS